MEKFGSNKLFYGTTFVVNTTKGPTNGVANDTELKALKQKIA